MTTKPCESGSLVPQFDEMRKVLDAAYLAASQAYEEGRPEAFKDELGAAYGSISALSDMKHAVRGAALTIAAYKAAVPSQNVCLAKAEIAGGFNARGADSEVTVPFLAQKGLHYNVETHWLTQAISFLGELTHDALKGAKATFRPLQAGALLVSAAEALQNQPDEEASRFASATASQLLYGLIKLRNSSKVVCTRPKGLTVAQAMWLVEAHIGERYKRNAPRLPQLALYSVYECLVASAARYAGTTLDPLNRMKSADRKKGTVGDVVVSRGGVPFEGVEIKHREITFNDIVECTEKLKAEGVLRYYVLATEDVKAEDAERIIQIQSRFKASNGCEIIVNGVFDSLSYYLRLIPDINEFIFKYVGHVETDADTDYEHRVVWNELCTRLAENG
jgi:DNA (cytosine-5)-methyltransferase 1